MLLRLHEDIKDQYYTAEKEHNMGPLNSVACMIGQRQTETHPHVGALFFLPLLEINSAEN